jgi:hypothetical protein
VHTDSHDVCRQMYVCIYIYTIYYCCYLFVYYVMGVGGGDAHIYTFIEDLLDTPHTHLNLGVM